MSNLVRPSQRQCEAHLNAESSGMQGICPKAAQQVDCGAQTLVQLRSVPQTMMLPAQKRFLFLMRQRPIYPPVSPGTSEAAQSPRSHESTDFEQPQPAHMCC